MDGSERLTSYEKAGSSSTKTKRHVIGSGRLPLSGDSSEETVPVTGRHRSGIREREWAGDLTRSDCGEKEGRDCGGGGCGGGGGRGERITQMYQTASDPMVQGSGHFIPSCGRRRGQESAAARRRGHPLPRHLMQTGESEERRRGRSQVMMKMRMMMIVCQSAGEWDARVRE